MAGRLGLIQNVAILDRGAGASLSSTTLAKQMIAFPFGQQGLMADLSLQGTKITTYRPDPWPTFAGNRHRRRDR